MILELIQFYKRKKVQTLEGSINQLQLKRTHRTKYTLKIFFYKNIFKYFPYYTNTIILYIFFHKI